MAEPTTYSVYARCIQSRLIGDDAYAAGETYVMDNARAEKYAALGYFTILAPPAPTEPEAEAEPPTKMRRPPENKAGWTPGLPNKEGEPVDLDGTPTSMSHTSIKAGGHRP